MGTGHTGHRGSEWAGRKGGGMVGNGCGGMGSTASQSVNSRNIGYEWCVHGGISRYVMALSLVLVVVVVLVDILEGWLD